jgi:aminoglycoside phosphotransferase family enzyme/predicted kinase
MAGVLDWLEALRDPACYPHQAHDLEVLQTHISVVCLAGDFAYKLKKPVALPFLDCREPARREFYCREEVRLNRRLCPWVYLDVVPLLRTGRGVRFGAAGERGDAPVDAPIDWAVRMTRLPQARMLDVLLRQRAATAGEIERLAHTVAAFHAGAERSASVSATGSPEKLAALARANFTELAAIPGHGLDEALLAALAAQTGRDFEALLPALCARAGRGLVVDGHGDLHARNICMTDPPAVYDCVEFAPAFRCGDVATENAFLAMDLRYRGAPELAAVYLQAYADATGDREQQALLPPLVRYRALVRAKVAALAAAERELPAADRDGARGSARAHLRLAAATAIEAKAPLWLVLCGPPASGKSALATALARGSGWPVFATDVVRKELAGLPPTARAGAAHYTAAFSDRTYREVFARAAASVAPVAILDGNFADAARRAEARAAAQAHGRSLHVLHVAVDEVTARARVAARARDPAAVSDAGPAEFAALWARFAPPTAAEGIAFDRVDGALAPEALADAAFARLLQRS